MTLSEAATPTPSAGQVLVQVQAAGVNFIDVYHRTGLYPRDLPFSPGLEGAGVVTDVGPGVTEFRNGDRIAWADVPGSYATHVVAPTDKVVRVPDGVDLTVAAAAMLQGLTAQYLSHSTYPLQAGETCLVHAAAGGVGLLLCQLAKSRGARVLGTTSSEAKAKLAREAGADEIIFYSKGDFVAEVKRLTGGAGVSVVYDSVGKDTFDKSLECLRRRGMLVTFGQSSGPVPPFDVLKLSKGGSLYLTRAKLADYICERAEFEARTASLFAAIAKGALRVRVHATFPLTAAAEAHRALEGRGTSGKLLLLP